MRESIAIYKQLQRDTGSGVAEKVDTLHDLSTGEGQDIYLAIETANIAVSSLPSFLVYFFVS